MHAYLPITTRYDFPPSPAVPPITTRHKVLVRKKALAVMDLAGRLWGWIGPSDWIGAGLQSRQHGAIEFSGSRPCGNRERGFREADRMAPRSTA